MKFYQAPIQDVEIKSLNQQFVFDAYPPVGYANDELQQLHQRMFYLLNNELKDFDFLNKYFKELLAFKIIPAVKTRSGFTKAPPHFDVFSLFLTIKRT